MNAILMPGLVRRVRAKFPPTTPRAFRILAFQDPTVFRKQAALRDAHVAEAFYDPRNATVYLPPHADRRCILHELVHAVMDADWHVTGPLWFAEGTADALAMWIEDRRLPPAVAADPSALMLERLDMYGPGFAEHYRVAREHVSYLLQHDYETFGKLLGRWT